MLPVLLIALQGAPTVAGSVEPKPVVITNPDWIRRPDARDLARLYPMQAAVAEVEGHATISCSVSDAGALVGCTVLSEEPGDMGFGYAALAMSGLFKMRPLTRDGQPVAGGQVRIPIRFGLPKGPQNPTPVPTLEVASRCYGFAAAKLEAAPASANTRVAFFAFRMLIELKLASQSPRPSELDRRLQSFQAEASTQLHDERYAADRAKCDGLASSFAGAGFERIVSEAADKPLR